MARPPAARHFYGRFGWAYDLLITDPVEPFVDRVVAVLAARGIAGGRLLDAGSGTGRYAIELAGRGFDVTAVDASPQLLEQAAAKPVPGGGHVDFHLGDILVLEATADFDAVLCRGVLNDLTEETERATAIDRLGGVLRPGGVLIVDVRDREASIERITRQPLVQHVVDLARGTLRYRSDRRIDAAAGLIVSEERFELTTPAGVERASAAFAMRPWSPDELRAHLTRAGFEDIDCQTGWRRRAGDTVTDRIFCTASRKRAQDDERGRCSKAPTS